MKEGMELLDKYDYIAVFDADFKPSADFLFQTIPYMEGNGKVGYVQTRWTFLNPNESFLTKAQEISLNFHVKCEQYVRFAQGYFFNFNGKSTSSLKFLHASLMRPQCRYRWCVEKGVH